MKKPLIIHPFLFALAPVLFLYSNNIGEVVIWESILPAAITFSFSILMWISLSAILKDKIKAGIITSVFFLLFFSYGHIYIGINNFVDGGNKVIRSRHLIPICVVIFTFSIYFTVKTKSMLHNLTKIMNVVSATFVLVGFINIVLHMSDYINTNKALKDLTKLEIGNLTSKNKSICPDIYYIVLDRYGSTSTLKDIYNYDNGEFIDFLYSKGFYVASESAANYPGTLYSLASSLNMEFINYLGKLKLPRRSSSMILYDKLQDYNVWRFLKSNGYEFIHFGSWWGPTSKNKYADMNFNLLKISDFLQLLYSTTILNPIFQKLGIYDWYRQHWKRVVYKFDRLSEIPKINGPTFVFAHMLIPHDPYVFDRNGNFLTQEESNKRSRAENYIDQIIYLNKKLIVLIDKLLSESKIPPIIILQSDEGPFPKKQTIQPKDFILSEFNNKELREKMRILNAYYLPGENRMLLYKNITPANSFRLVFNLYFNTNLKLLSDESFIIDKTENGLKFINITDKIKYH